MFDPSALVGLTRRLGPVLAAALLFAGCFDQPLAPADESNERLAVTNDSSTLARRISHPETPIPIDAVTSGAASVAGMPGREPSVELTLVAEVESPVVGGEVVQATSVSVRNPESIVVSYNDRGATRRGAVDRIRRRGRRYELSASVAFADADISAVDVDGSQLYAAQATDAEGFPFPAAVERLRLRGLGIQLEENTRTALSSFAATSVLEAGGFVYVTTGDDGDLFALDPDDLSVLAQHPLDDARWVARDEERGRLVVVQGTPGRVSVFEEGASGGSLTLLDSFGFPGADVPESKSTVDVADGKAFVAAGPEGVQIVCLEDGRLLGSVPRPDPAVVGLPPEVVVTNAVTVDGNVMFISNGEAGVYVAVSDRDFGASGCDDQEITVLGHLRFGDRESVNHVDLEGDVLLVAGGLGGVKIVDVQVLD